MNQIVWLFLFFLGVHTLNAFDDSFDKIIGGEDAKLGEFPWQISLRKFDFHFCGGVIIKEQWVLTTAHCTKGLTTKLLTVVAGKIHKKDPEPNEQSVSVDTIYQHEKFNKVNFENDISLLKLADPLTFNSFVNAVQVPKIKKQSFLGNCNVSGWGSLTPTGKYPEILQKVSIPLISEEECQKRIPEEKIFASVICAWTKGKDACNGDSGGPMVCRGEDGDVYLAGLASWGIECADDIFPGIYTEVSYFLDWISETIERYS